VKNGAKRLHSSKKGRSEGQIINRNIHVTKQKSEKTVTHYFAVYLPLYPVQIAFYTSKILVPDVC
jgi:hypothetical protein